MADQLNDLLDVLLGPDGLEEAVGKSNPERALKAFNDFSSLVIKSGDFPKSSRMISNPAELKTAQQFHAALRNAEIQLNHWVKQKKSRAW